MPYGLGCGDRNAKGGKSASQSGLPGSCGRPFRHQYRNGAGNSIVLLGRLLYALRDMQIRINDLDAPGKANAIASNGAVCFYIKQEDLDSVKAKIREVEKTFQAELQYTDSISFQLDEGSLLEGAVVYTEMYQKKIMNSLMLLPYGVAGYSFAIEGLIETSMNMGALTMEDRKAYPADVPAQFRGITEIYAEG